MFNITSQNILINIHPELALLMTESRKGSIFFELTDGLRPKSKQDYYFRAGASKVPYPESRHNQSLILNSFLISDAVDIILTKKNGQHDWHNKEGYDILHNHIMTIWDYLYHNSDIHHKIRWGGDLDSKGNGNSKEELNDPYHYELRKEFI